MTNTCIAACKWHIYYNMETNSKWMGSQNETEENKIQLFFEFQDKLDWNEVWKTLISHIIVFFPLT